MRKWAVVMLFSLPAFGQAFYQFPVPLPGATFRVCPVGSQNPCPSPANIFSDQGLTQLIPQPAQTGVTGNFGFWIAAGQYTIQVAQPYNLVYIVNIGTSGGGGAIPTGITAQQLIYTSPSAVGGQTKAVYDVRDWMTCDGVTNATVGMNNLINTIGSNSATVYVVGQCKVAILNHPPNVTLDFSGGGSILLIANSTSPGGGAFVQGSGQSNAQASPTSTCSATLTNTTAGNGILMFVSLYGTFASDNARVSSVTDTKNFYQQQMQTTLGQAAYEAAYVASSIAGGTVTVTANFSHAEKNACIAWEVSGLGPVIGLDASTFTYGSTTPFSTGPVTLTAGDFVAMFNEDPNDPQTCTVGAGYTQPAGLAGNVGTASTNGVAECAQYQNSGAGGATSGTQSFSSSPVASSDVAVLAGFKPGIASWFARGGIINPDLHQICFNCTGTNGILDFSGNLAVTNVYPEWWGACSSCTAAVNTPAIQASEIGAFGTKRVNGSGLNIYNKTWTLLANYQINAEIQFYHVSGNAAARAEVWCGSGGGLTQAASNLRILDGQSDAYLRFDNCVWSGSAPNTGALTDFGYSGAQGTDFAPQFIDFYSNSWNGNGQVAIGLLGAKEGGGAQFSNIYCYDCLTEGFTTAGWQIGTASLLAANALAIGYSGDMQGNPQYGFACYGCGYVTIGGGTGQTSFENGFSTQTGFDVFCSLAQGPCVLEHVRSESRKIAFCGPCQLKDVFAINQSSRPNPATSYPVGTVVSGSQVAGDGAYYKITVDSSNFGGTGIPSAPIQASGGSASTVANTNQSLTGSVTVATLPGASLNETMTQAVTGATGTRLTSPANNATITGTASGAQIQLNEVMKQAVTNVTCTEQSPTPNTGTSQNLICNNFSGTADSSHAWTGQTSAGVYTPNASPSFAAASPVLLLGGVTGSPDSTHIWTGGTSAGQYTPTQAPQPANYTVNAFAGMLVGIFTGTNALCYGTVASNTSTTITISGGWITKYPGVPCSAPDSTSTFVVEPGWNHGTVVSGGITMVYMNENVIDGDNGAFGTFEDVIAYGGQWHMNATPTGRTSIKHATVSRSDWYTPIGATPQARATLSLSSPSLLGTAIDGEWDVIVLPPAADRPQAWSNLTSGGAVMDLSGYKQNLGPRKFCWNAEGTNTGTAPANEVCIGGRSDPNSTTDATRALVEIEGYLGSPAPVPNAGNSYSLTNQAGTATSLTGGPSTGNANGGSIDFYISTPGSSGTTVNSGTKRWSITAAGNLAAQSTQSIIKGSVTFSNLPASPVNGQEIYCSDCTVTTPASCTNVTNTAACTCASSGTGAMAKRINGAWLCN